ncbi:MAG: hypothetical protein VZR06_00245 [Butyrivibrio sp.]|nr:hypothetical protein [Butyrivibrio sp.]
MKVELYVQGKTKNPAQQKRAQASWLISCALSNGTVERRDGLVTLNHATTKRAVLCALIEALKIFNKAAVIKIYISDDFVRAVLINGWLGRWKANGWHKIRLNGQIRYVDLWLQVSERLANHGVTFARGEELNNETLIEMERRLNLE